MTKQFILDLVKQMTIEEKAAQLTQIGTFMLEGSVPEALTGPYREWKFDKEDVLRIGSCIGWVGAKRSIEVQKKFMEQNRLHIPVLIMSDIIHGMKTIFPIPLAMGATFHPELIKETCRVAALESAVSGIHVTFSPMADLVRDPRWGRVMESTGEDPYLNAVMTKAMVEGYQGEDIREKGRMAACVKHFAAYGAAEGGRDYNTVDMSRGVLRDFYLPAYKAAVDAKVAMVMASFNTVDRIPASANRELLHDMLRDEWGFDGTIISDFNAIDEVINHSVAEDGAEAARLCLNAGLDIEMMSGIYINEMKTLLEEKKLTMEQIDECVIHVLNLKDRLGLFENPYKDADEELEAKYLLCREHRKLARQCAIESMVLLKNDGVLPVKKGAVIGVAGPMTLTKKVLGGWHAEGRYEDAVSLYEGLVSYLGEESVVTAMTAEVGEKLHGFVDVPDEVDAAIEKLKACDVVICAVGEHENDAGEAGSLTRLRLSPNQEKLIHSLKAKGKTVITVLFTGRPMEIEPVLTDSDAIVQAWYGGTETGNAITALLFGEANFSGRLTMSFPRNVGQIPVYYNSYKTGRPLEGLEEHTKYASRYVDCKNDPLYPFGYGLSYSEFEYSELSVSGGEGIDASIQVKNVSETAGTETVQLYIRDISASVVQPVKALKAFQQITLQPGERQKVSFYITREQLMFYNNKEQLVFEPGWFEVMIGCSSADVKSDRIYIQ